MFSSESTWTQQTEFLEEQRFSRRQRCSFRFPPPKGKLPRPRQSRVSDQEPSCSLQGRVDALIPRRGPRLWTPRFFPFGAVKDIASCTRGFAHAIYVGYQGTAHDRSGPVEVSFGGSRCGAGVGSPSSCRSIGRDGSAKARTHAGNTCRFSRSFPSSDFRAQHIGMHPTRAAEGIRGKRECESGFVFRSIAKRRDDPRC
jgi:hypothetical protein